MVVTIIDVLAEGHIVHSTGWALTGLVAAAAFAVHGANIGGGVLFGCAMRFCLTATYTVLVLMVGTASGKYKYCYGKDEVGKFFHVLKLSFY
jgi:hypothetical protein